MGGYMDRRAMLAGMGALSLNGIAAKAMAEAAGVPDKAELPPRPSIETYVRSPEIEDVSLSPDGKRIALITKNAGAYVLVTYEIATDKTSHLRLGEAKIRSVFWASNTHVMINSSTTVGLREFVGNRQEHTLAHILDIRTNKLKTLFDRMENYYNTVQGGLRRIKHEGEYCVTASNYEMTGAYPLCLYRFDLESYRGRLIDAGYDDTRNWVLTPEGLPVARASFNQTNKLWSLEFRQPKGGWKQVYKVKEAVDYPSLIGLGRSDQSVILYIDAGDNAGEYFEVSADGTFSEPLDKGGYNRGPMFHPTTKRFCGFARWDDWVSYEYSDPKMQKLADVCKGAMPGYNVAIYEFAEEDPRKVLIYGESSDDPGTYYFIDFGSGDSLPVGESYPDLPTQWITQKKPIKYKAADGLEIHGYLTLPPQSHSSGAAVAHNKTTPKNLPLIVLPHGGPHARDTSSFDWESQLYASRGYAVLQPNFRGSTGYGDDFIVAGYGQWGRKMQTDLSDGVRHLAREGIIDPKRVAIVGASYGGYAALAGATLDPGIYRCAVSVAGICDIKAMLSFDTNQTGSSTSPVMLSLKRSVGDRKTLDEISPVNHVDKVTIPILLIHGKDDIVVDIGQSRKMERALKNAGKDVTFIELKGEDHWGSVEEKRLESSNAIVAFLEKHNPPA